MLSIQAVVEYFSHCSSSQGLPLTPPPLWSCSLSLPSSSRRPSSGDAARHQQSSAESLHCVEHSPPPCRTMLTLLTARSPSPLGPKRGAGYPCKANSCVGTGWQGEVGSPDFEQETTHAPTLCPGTVEGLVAHSAGTLAVDFCRKQTHSRSVLGFLTAFRWWDAGHSTLRERHVVWEVGHL